MNDQPAASDFVQARRVLRVHSPIGENALLPERARIVEGVNQLFEIEIAVRSKKDIKPDELIGKLVDVELEVAQGEDDEDPVYRPFNGLVSEMHEGPAVTRGLRSYMLILRPSLWLLSQTRDSRTWMDRSTLDVLDTLLSEHGLPRADTAGVVSPPPPIHYSCQFNESDLNYLLQRFEQDGLFWWFTHEKGAHKLRVANHPSGWLQPSKAAQGENRVRVAAGSSDRNHIGAWTRRFAYVPGRRTGADWNYKTFGTIPLNTTPSLVALPENAKREVFEWPAYSMTHEEAEQAEKLRSQATEADHEKVSGSSTVRILEPGRRFAPYDEANPEANYEEHVVVSAVHQIVDRSYETASSEPEYRNAFEAIPARVPLTPHRTTRKPRIEGMQVAVVAGPKGEEIHCDSDGCVKVWFPWQRHRAKKDGTDTKWIRVGQNWAGTGWGGQVIPRIGMEVMVTFIDGDPDRPFITGIAPNPINKVPYDLPSNKTKSTFRTNTHKGHGFNELSFEDEKDREEIYIHAQKDHTLHVENNQSVRIENNHAESIRNNAMTTIGNNAITRVGGDLNVNVGGKLHSTAEWLSRFTPFTAQILDTAYSLGAFGAGYAGIGNYNLSVANNKTETVAISSYEAVGIAKATTVAGRYEVNIGADSSEVVRKTKLSDVGEVYGILVGEEFQVVCGKSRLILKSNGEISLEGEHISIKGGKRIDLN